jgi:hypothetical protein
MKVAILLPAAPGLMDIRKARKMARLLRDCSNGSGASVEIAIGLPEMASSRWRAIEKDLREDVPEAIVRPLRWERVSTDNARRMFAALPADLDLAGIETVVVPRDWGWNFLDCDAFLVLAGPALGAILPLRPTAFYCSDLAVRIVPQAFGESLDDPYWARQTESFRMWRQAMVLTSDPATVDDIVSFAGVRKERVELIPNTSEAASAATPATARDPDSLVWLLKASPLYDLENAVTGLQTYLAEHGRLQPLIVSESSSDFDPISAAPFVESLEARISDFLYSLPRQHVGSERELLRLLGRSGVLWSSLLAGGEAEAAILAKRAGLALIAADYETNRRMVDETGVRTALYRLSDPLEIADALHRVEGLAARVGRPKSSRDNAVAASQRKRVASMRTVLERLRASRTD